MSWLKDFETETSATPGSSDSRSSLDGSDLDSSMTPVMDFSEDSALAVPYCLGKQTTLAEQNLVKQAFAVSIQQKRADAESWYWTRGSLASAVPCGDCIQTPVSEQDLLKQAFAVSIQRRRADAESWYSIRRQEIKSQRRAHKSTIGTQTTPVACIPGILEPSTR